jgi:fatty acid kinase fatty acid binding subunit
MPAVQRPVKVVVDSAADIPKEIAERLDMTIVPLSVQMGGKTYLDGIDISGEAFYRELASTRSITTTSLPSIDALAEAYRRITAAGCDVLSIHLSSKLSGTYNTALMASRDDGITPGTITVVDSRTICMSEGWCAIEAAEAAHAGKPLPEVVAVAELAAKRSVLYGALDTLEYVMKSGRLSRLPGTVGTLLSIKPILTMRQNGEAAIIERVRTRRRALQRLAELAAQLGPLGRVAVMHAADPDGAAELLDLIRPLRPPQPVVVSHIGAVLGTHIGPRGVGICCLKA